MPDGLDITTLIIPAFILLNAVFILLVLYANYRQLEATRAAWNDLAMRTGLDLQRGNFVQYPALSGDYRRRPLALSTFSRGSGRSRTTYTQVRLTVTNGSGGKLTLRPEGFLSGLGKALGMQDVQIGDPTFDKRFTVQGQPLEFVMTLLDESMLRDGLLKLSGSFTLALDGAVLSYVVIGVVRDVDRLEALFNLLSDLADRVDGDKPGGKW